MVLEINQLCLIFAGMYFKVSMRTNPATGRYSGYYRLVESYRSHSGRVCHRTVLNAGYLDGIQPEQLNQIQKILTAKAESALNPLFEIPYSSDPIVLQHVEEYFSRMVAEKRIDLPAAKPPASKKDFHTIDVNSIKNKDVREVGAEWMCVQAINQLGIPQFLRSKGWAEEDISTAATHIAARAAYPASELETSRWIRDNSAICELTGASPGMVTKDRLYRISRRLHELQLPLEQYLSTKTNELFDLEDKILLFDLTNTYFEGRMVKSSIAQFGRSKEKRSDAKLVVLAAVANTEGFIKYSSILNGNMADCKTLAGMIETIRANTSSSAKKATVVIDAGIATDENLKMIKENGYEYICVSRAALMKYSVAADAQKITVKDNKNQAIELQRVEQEKNTDYYLKIDSHAKALKESSMENRFTERFEEELQKIAASLTKKGGVKQEDKVYLRLGRLQQKYPSAYRNYTFDIRVAEPAENAEKDAPLPSKRIVVSMEWTKNEASAKANTHGTYFIRTSLTGLTEELLWQFYNTIREIEATFRCLKTDLDLRPVYHKSDDNVMAHLHLGLLAYWIVNTVRFQLKKSGISSSWGEIVRIMNTQKAVTTTAENIRGEVVSIRKCSEPTEQVKKIYTALKYKHTPFARKKSVVHKQDSKNQQFADNYSFNSE